MVGKWRGFTTVLKNEEIYRNDQFTYHCIVHQENLVALHSNSFDSTMKEVTDAATFIRAHPLYHHKFRELLKEFGTHYDELAFHCEVCCLSKGSVLDHFFQPITDYLSDQNNKNITNGISGILSKLNNKD